MSQPIKDAVEPLRVEYLEMPDLALTPSQVAALLDLDGVTAGARHAPTHVTSDECVADGRRVAARAPNGELIVVQREFYEI